MEPLSALEKEMIGVEIGGYRVVELIGRGGMGAVFLATHKTLKLQTAIKIMRQDFADERRDELRVERFLDESRALAEVQHPSLVRLYDAGTLPNGIIFMQMELLKGETLRERLDRLGGKLALPEATALARQLASALQVVHVRGIAHRDLTPRNILIVEESDADFGERAKILDFGIAKFRDTVELRTEPQQPIGTPRYMSPEQWEASALIDERTDVYTLGLLLFELLTGQSPFVVAEDIPVKWMQAHLGQRPRRLSELMPQAPARLDALVEMMLDKLPEQRPTMATVFEELRRCEQEGPLRWPEGRVMRLLRRVALGAIPALVVALVIFARTRQTLVRSSSTDSARTSAIDEKKQTEELDDAVAASRTPEGMAFIKGQTFLMGSTPDEAKAALVACQEVTTDCKSEEVNRELPQRLVKVRSFYLDRFEVTNQQYTDFLNAPVKPPQEGRYVHSGRKLLIDLEPEYSGIVFEQDHYRPRAGFARLPVVQVSWYGARLYCGSLGRQLPTEAQWELAARGLGVRSGAVPTPYPWGFEKWRCDDVVVARAKSGVCQHKGPGPREVGSAVQDVTPQGVHDLGGNVREWVRDVFLAPYPPCGKCIDPFVGATEDEVQNQIYRVARGSNWLLDPTMARSAARSKWLEERVSVALGFRCASVVARDPTPDSSPSP